MECVKADNMELGVLARDKELQKKAETKWRKNN